MARNVTQTKTAVSIDDLDYAILGILAKFTKATNDDLFALKMHVTNTAARIKSHLKRENMTSTAVSTSLGKLANMKLVSVGQSFNQVTSNLGINTYEITSDGRTVLAEKPESLPLINNGGDNDYQGPNIR